MTDLIHSRLRYMTHLIGRRASRAPTSRPGDSARGAPPSQTTVSRTLAEQPRSRAAVRGVLRHTRAATHALVDSAFEVNQSRMSEREHARACEHEHEDVRAARLRR